MTEDVAESSAQLARLATLRVINEYVERFHVSAQTAAPPRLRAIMGVCHTRILRTLRLRSLVEGEAVEAHVLEVRRHDLSLATYLEPTDPEQSRFVPEMRLPLDGGRLAAPPSGSGVATYCLYRALIGAPGAALLHDVRASRDVTYFRRGKHPGAYEIDHATDVYKPGGDGEPPPYRALLCVAVPRIVNVEDQATERVLIEWRHVLSVTSTVPAAFSIHDVAWVEAVASLLGSLYGSYQTRLYVTQRQRTAESTRTRKR